MLVESLRALRAKNKRSCCCYVCFILLVALFVVYFLRMIILVCVGLKWSSLSHWTS